MQEANAAFRNLLSSSTQQLKAIAKKLGSCIDKSRPFYDAYDEYKSAQEKCQEAAVQFQKAFGSYLLQGYSRAKNNVYAFQGYIKLQRKQLL